MTRLDYTKKRLNSRSGHGSRKIERCPKCGRKGSLKRLKEPRIWMCDHEVNVDTWGGIDWITATDSCSGPILDDGTLVVRPLEGEEGDDTP